MNKFDTVISGGGLSGLITAIALKGMGYKGSIFIAEQQNYPFKANGNFIITPIARQLLHNLPLYRKHNYCEGRFVVYKFVNQKHNISFSLPDTAVMGYSDFIYQLYEIAVNNGVHIRQDTEVLDYNFNDKYIVMLNDKIHFDNIVIAEGSREYPVYDNFLGSDIEEYNFQVNVKSDKGEMQKSSNLIYVGDSGGFKDFLIDINCIYGIISAIYAAETIYKGNNAPDYYESVKDITKNIEASKILRNNRDFDFIKNVLMGVKSYSDYL